MEQNVKRFWNAEAAEHAKTAYQYYENPEQIRYPFFEVRLDRLKEIFDALPLGKILDAGCGSGEILLECLRRGWDGQGCDIAENMVALARQRIELAGFDPQRVRVSSITHMPDYADATFDAIVCPGVLEYLSEAEERLAFAEFRRVLKPSGALVVENVNALFDLSTFNRFTLAFFQTHFLPKFFREQSEIDEAAGLLRDLIVHPDKPDRQGRYATTRDQVFNRTEIPFEYKDKAKRLGFTELKQVFYRFHAVPPLLFEKRPDYERVSIAFEKEYSNHWIGYFLATGFISILRKE